MKVATPQTNTAQAKYKPQQDLCSKYLFEVKNNEDFERAAYWNLHSSLNLHFGKQQYPGLIPYLIEVIKRDGDLSDIKDKLGIELTEKQQAQLNGPIQELRALRALMKDLGVYYEKLFVPDDYVHNPFEALKADVLVEFKNKRPDSHNYAFLQVKQREKQGGTKHRTLKLASNDFKMVKYQEVRDFLGRNYKLKFKNKSKNISLKNQKVAVVFANLLSVTKKSLAKIAQQIKEALFELRLRGGAVNLEQDIEKTSMFDFVKALLEQKIMHLHPRADDDSIPGSVMIQALSPFEQKLS